MSWLLRQIHRIRLPRLSGQEATDLVIDLRGVSTRDDFQRELTRHFPIADDHRGLWDSLWVAINAPVGPIRLRFLGWSEFEGQMPRYARRLRRTIEVRQRLWEGLSRFVPERRFVVEYQEAGIGSGKGDRA